MTTEKLAKAVATPTGSREPASATHVMFVRMLQTIKGRPDIRRQLGFDDTKAFTSFIDSLLDLARRIERLSPDQAGFTSPNPEYPWCPGAGFDVIVPADYAFPQFDPRDPKLNKLHALVRSLLNIIQ